MFIDKVKKLFGTENYMIGASWLIRAQQTAYYMLAKNSGKKINIFPHIAEIGEEASNIALSKNKQMKIYTKKNPGIIKLFNPSGDWRDDQTILNRDKKVYFFDWINKNIHKLQEAKGSDNTYRLVIFTHGVWLYQTFNFKNPKILEWPANNHIFHTILNDQFDMNDKYDASGRVDPQSLIQYDAEGKKLENTFRHENLEEINKNMYKCPDNCRESFCNK
jgi:hypothetical protein